MSIDAVVHEGGSVRTKLASVAVKHLPKNQEAESARNTQDALEIMEAVKTQLDTTAKDAFWHQLQIVERARVKSSKRPGLFGMRAAHQYSKKAAELKQLAITSSTQVRAKAFKPDSPLDTQPILQFAAQPGTSAPEPIPFAPQQHPESDSDIVSNNGKDANGSKEAALMIPTSEDRVEATSTFDDRHISAPPQDMSQRQGSETTFAVDQIIEDHPSRPPMSTTCTVHNVNARHTDGRPRQRPRIARPPAAQSRSEMRYRNTRIEVTVRANGASRLSIIAE